MCANYVHEPLKTNRNDIRHFNQEQLRISNSHKSASNYLPKLRDLGNRLQEEIYRVSCNQYAIKRMRLNFMHDRWNNLVFLWADGMRLFGVADKL